MHILQHVNFPEGYAIQKTVDLEEVESVQMYAVLGHTCQICLITEICSLDIN